MVAARRIELYGFSRNDFHISARFLHITPCVWNRTTFFPSRLVFDRKDRTAGAIVYHHVGVPMMISSYFTTSFSSGFSFGLYLQSTSLCPCLTMST